MKLFPQTKSIYLLLIVGFILLTGSSIFAYIQLQKLINTSNWIIHTYEVISSSNNTLLAITDVEGRVNLHAFLLQENLSDDTRENIFGDPSYEQLKKLVQDNPAQVARVEELQSLLNNKLILRQKAIMDTANGDSRALVKYVTSKERANIRKHTRLLLNKINQAEIDLLKERESEFFHHMRLANSFFMLIAILGGILYVIVFILLYSLLTQIATHEKKQKIIQKELKDSEERFLLTTEGSNVGIWDWELGTDNVYYSAQFKRMLGYSDKDFPNNLQSFNNILHPYDYVKVWILVNQHLERKAPYFAEYRLRTHAGIYRWYQASGQAIWNDKGKPFRMSGTIIDITERKRAEQELEIQYAVTKTLANALNLEQASVEIIKDMCKILDWQIGSLWLVDEEKQLIQCSGMWYSGILNVQELESETKHSGLEKGIILPGKIWEKAHPIWVDIESSHGFIRKKAALLAGLKTAFGFPILLQKRVLGVIEFFTVNKVPEDKKIIDMMMSLAPQIGQFIKRKSAENEVVQSNSYKTAILESVTDGILTLNDKGIIMSCNLQVLKEFDYALHELEGQSIKKIIADWEISFLDKLVGEYSAVDKNGQRFPVEIRSSIMNSNKDVIHVLSITNITERKKIEKMKNEFVSIVSHELRTPLTSIKGSLGLVLGGNLGDFSEKIKHLLQIANNNCERLLLLINDILDIEKIEAGKMTFKTEIIDIQDLIQKCLEEAKMYAVTYEVTLGCEFDVEHVVIKADPDRLSQVVLNLLSNAIKFSPSHERVLVKAMRIKDKVQISVSNRGPGIPMEFQTKIFQKFSQVDSTNKRLKGGTGLGLNISKSIIEKMGGQIHFVSKPGEITTFYLTFPIYVDDEQLKKVKADLTEMLKNKKKGLIKQPGGKERLLICEDDEEQAKYMAALLESAGFEIDIAYNAKKTRELLFKHHHEYHALLLDLILPDQDGIALIRELRNNPKTQDLPIIVISVIAETGRTLLQGKAITVLDWLSKPLDFAKLLQSIKKIKRDKPKLLNVLHIEDDPDTSALMHQLIEPHANIIIAENMANALNIIKNVKLDLVILDLLLPDGSGTDLIPLLAEYKLPVIVYSAFELDQKYAEIVSKSLIKSKTSNEALINVIKKALDKMPEGGWNE